MVMGMLLLAIAAFIELVLRAPVLSAFFYVPSALTVPISTLTAYIWFALTFGRMH
jgi:hypothetical protein